MGKKKTEDDDIGFVLIDSPVGFHSHEEDIILWIDELKTYPDRPEVREAMNQAEEFLKRKEEKGGAE